MFRSIGIEGREKIKFQLYNNRTEILEDIPNDFISNCVFKLTEPDTFEIIIPKYIGKDKKTHPLYNKIKSKQQVIVTSSSGMKKRFILQAKKQMGSNKNGSKKFTAYGFEKTLENHRITIAEGNYQLISDETHIAKGALELALEGSRWKIGYVDPQARMETQVNAVTVPTVLFENFTKDSVQYEQVIFEKDVTTPLLQPDHPLYLTIQYNEVSTYNGENILKTENVINLLEPLYTGLKHIKATYYQEAGNRWGVKYELTLVDGVVETQYFAFTNVTDKNIKIKDIKLLYETGEYEEVPLIMYPYLSSYDDNVYNILKDLETVFNCIFIFDTYNKIINCYSKDNYGEEKGLLLSFDTNIIELNIDESESIPNAMKVIGKDNLSIASENIFGGNILYNYDYYISEGIMDKELVSKWERYLKYADVKREEWNLLKSNRQLLVSKQIQLSTEAESLSKRIAYSKNILAGLVEANDEENQKIKQAELTELEGKFNSISAELNSLQEQINGYDDKMENVGTELKRENVIDSQGKIFNEVDLEIFDDIEEVVTVSDSYFSVPYALLKHYEKELEDKVIPTIDFDMDTDDLVKYIPKWTNLVSLGDLYTVDKPMREILKQDKVRLLEIEYDAKTNRVKKVKFCNKSEKVDKLRNLNNSGRKVSEAVNTNNTFKNIWEDARLSNNYVKTLRENGMTLVTNSINSKSDSCILDMGSSGIWVMNAQDKNKQVAITSGIIAITTDGWKTSDTAITSEFINADLLMGKIIAGENLYITSDTGGFYVGNTSEGKEIEDFGLKITDSGQVDSGERIFLGLETDSDGVRRAKLRLRSKNGGAVVLDENGIIQTSQFLVWDNLSPSYPMRIPYVCDEGVVSNKKVLMSLVFEKYRAFERGMSSGGTVSTSSSGGGGTSESGGGGTSSSGGGGTSASGGGGTSGDGGVTSVSGGGTTSASNGGYNGSYTQTSQPETWMGDEYTGSFMTGLSNDYFVDPIQDHYHVISASLFKHSHNVWIGVDVPNHTHTVPSHSHTMPTHSHTIPSHTHTIPDHTHTIPSHTHTIKNHTHTLDTTHNHELEYAIHEQNSICRNVRVYVNDTLVASGLNSDRQIDITNYIGLNKTNNIRIETESNGRITCNIFTKAFVSF